MTEKVYVFQNGKKIEAKGKELDYILSWQAELQAEENKIKAEQQAKEELKQSAIAKLAAIGLTEDEAKIIIGVN